MDKDDAVELRFISDSPVVTLADRRLAKDVIAAGRYHYVAEDPKTKVRTPAVLEVPESRIDHWIADGNAMLAAGVRVPMPLDHDEENSDRNRGFVERYEKHFDEKGVPWVRTVLDVPDVPGAEKIGKTIREVSVKIAKRLVDGAGRVWTDVIRHVSPCILPVVLGQGNFIELKQVTDSEALLGGSAMDELVKLLGEMSGCAEKAGVKLDDLTAENAMEKLKLILAWMAGQSFTAIQMKELQDKVDASTAEVVELKAKYEPEPHEPTPEEIRLKAELDARDTQLATLRSREIDAEVDALLKSRRIVAAKAPLVKAMLGASSGGDVLLKSVDGGKEVETAISPAEGLRIFLKSLPVGAAFATGKPAAGATAVAEPVEPEGEDPERKRMAALAHKIAKEEGISLQDAQVRAEAQLKQTS